MKNLEIEGTNYNVPSFIESVSVSSEEIDGGYIKTEFNIKTRRGTDECVINVQVCGATYQPQNGCYLDGEYIESEKNEKGYDGGEFIHDFDDNDEMLEFIEKLQCIAISEAENFAEHKAEADLDEQSETASGETWKWLDTLDSEHHSATSTIDTTTETSSTGRYRIVKKMSGFVQPNDYAAEPEPELIAFFENKSEYLDR